MILHQEIKWRQKSRTNWRRYWDSNTIFFHSFANCRKTKNQISSLIISGSEVEDMQRIENDIFSLYKQLYTNNQPVVAWLSSWTGKVLSRRRTHGWEDLLLRRKSKRQFFPWRQTKHPVRDLIFLGFFPRMLRYC